MSRVSARNHDHNQSLRQESSYAKKNQSLKTEGPQTSRAQVFPDKQVPITHFSTSSIKENSSFVNAMKALQDKICKLEFENVYLKESLTNTLTEIDELKLIIEDIRFREQEFIQMLEKREDMGNNRQQEFDDLRQHKVKQLEVIVNQQRNELQQIKKGRKIKENTLSVDEFTLDQLLKEFQASQTNFKQISNSLIFKYGSSPMNRKEIDQKDNQRKIIIKQDGQTNKKKSHVYDQVRVPSFSHQEGHNDSQTNTSQNNFIVLRQQEKLLDELNHHQIQIEQKIQVLSCIKNQNLSSLQNSSLAEEMQFNLHEQLELIVQQKQFQLSKVQQFRTKLL